MARIALVAAVLLVACGVALGIAPTTQTLAPATPRSGPQAPATPQAGASVFGSVVAVDTFVVGFTAANFPAAEWCQTVQTTTGATNCTVTDVQNTNLAGQKFHQAAQGVLVSYQVTSINPSGFLNQVIAVQNANNFGRFVVTRSAAGVVVSAPSPTPAVVVPSASGTLAVVDWVIVGTSTTFDLNSQASFRSAIVQALGGPQNASVIINPPITQTTVGRKMTTQTSALRVTTSISAPNYVSSAAIIQRLQDTVRNNGGRIGAFTVISLSGDIYNAAALTRPTIMWAAAAILLIAMLF